MKTLVPINATANALIRDDTVRPELDYSFRVTNGRECYVLMEYGNPGAVICIAYTDDVPVTIDQLQAYSHSKGTIAVFYTVWSYYKGFGRDIVFKTVDHIKLYKPHVNRFITLSPKTEMAKKFHLSNGATTLSENETSVNYEYLV